MQRVPAIREEGDLIMTRYAMATIAVTTASLWIGGCTEKEVKAEKLGPGDVMKTQEPADVFATIVRQGRCSTLVRALRATGLAETLTGPGPFTVFAPTDEAFAALPEGRLNYLMERPEELKAILLGHIAPARIPSSEITWSKTIRTITGQRLAVTVEDGIERIDGAVVVERDVMATNGVVHIVDALVAGFVSELK